MCGVVCECVCVRRFDFDYYLYSYSQFLLNRVVMCIFEQ